MLSLDVDGGQAPSNAEEERPYKHVHQAGPDHVDGGQCHHAALDHWHHHPNMYTAEDPENNPCNKRHGNGQKRGEDPVEDVFHQLENSMTTNPNSVKAVCGVGLSDDVFKTNL